MEEKELPEIEGSPAEPAVKPAPEEITQQNSTAPQGMLYMQQPSPVQYVTVLPFGMTAETYQEKKALRKIGNTIGISLLISEGFLSVWSFLYFYVMAVFGFSQLEAYHWAVNPAIQQLLQIGLSSLAFLVPALLLFKTREGRISDIAALSSPKRGAFIPLFFFGMAFCMFANICESLFSQFFAQFGIEYHMEASADPPGWFGFLLSFLSTAIFPALVEEFVFRGLIFGSLKKYGDGFAIFASSILFGLVHGNFEQIPFAFLVGLVLGFIVAQTGSLWIAMAVHAANNFISVFFSYALPDVTAAVRGRIYTVLIMACFLLGLAALSLTDKKEGGFRLKKAETASTEKQKAKWFAFTPTVFIFSAVCFFKALTALLEGLA